MGGAPLQVQCYDNVVYYCLITDDDVEEESGGRPLCSVKTTKYKHYCKSERTW